MWKFIRIFSLMNKIQQFLNNLLQGRHGADELSMFLSILGLVLIVGAPAFTGSVYTILVLLGVAALGASLFRVFSKNTEQRNRENYAFTSFFRRGGAEREKKRAARVAEKEKKRRLKEKLKTHEMFYCPKCNTACFVPKGKGKVRITCPKCGEKFIGKT